MVAIAMVVAYDWGPLASAWRAALKPRCDASRKGWRPPCTRGSPATQTTSIADWRWLADAPGLPLGEIAPFVATDE